MMESPATLVLVIAILGYGVVTLVRWPAAAVPLILAAVFVPLWFPQVGLMLGPVALYPTDAIALVLLIAAGGRRVFAEEQSKRSPVWVALLVLATYALLRGSAIFGVESAGQVYRSWIHFLAGVLFATTIDPSRAVRAMTKWWSVAGGLFIITTAIFVAQNGAGSFANEGTRALVGTQALILGQATIMWMLPIDTLQRDRRLRSLLIIAGLTALLLSQQRTVWAAMVVSVALITSLPLADQTARSAQAAKRIAAAGFLLVVAVLVLRPSGLSTSIGFAVEEATNEQSTFTWRIEGWEEILEYQLAASTHDILLGNPSGVGFDRTVNSVVVKVAPHSFYIFVFSTVGLVGVLLLFGHFIGVAKRLTPLAKVDPEYLLLLTLLAGQAVYSMTYEIGIEQGFILAVASQRALAVVKERRPSLVSATATTR